MGKKSEEDEDELQRTDTSASKKKNWPKPTISTQFKAVFGSWINLMLVFVPIGIALHEVDSVSRIVVFVLNFLAIIPLAAMLSFATEELALYVGETLGGLLNASFGNAVELIVSIIALAQKKILIVQTSLVRATFFYYKDRMKVTDKRLGRIHAIQPSIGPRYVLLLRWP